MGFINDKGQIVQQVSIFEVLGNLPKNRKTSSFDSVSSKSRNLLPFMLDLLTISCKDHKNNLKGQAKCELTRIILEILVEFFPVLIRTIKEGIIKAIKAGLVCPADFKIPSPAPTTILKMSEADYSKLMKVDPTKFPGNLLFGDADTDLNLFLSNLIQIGGSASWKNLLVFNYNQTTEQLDVTIDNDYVGVSFDVFLVDYINSIELINFKNLLPNLMNQLYGSIDASLPNFDFETSVSKEKTSQLIEKILETDPCEDTFILDDNFFEFSSDDLLTIESNANNRKAGVLVVDYGCSPYISTVSNITLNELITDLNSNPSSQAKQITESYIQTLASEAISVVGDGGDSEQQKKSFSVKMTLALPKMFTDVIFTPKIVVLNQVSQFLITNSITSVVNSFDYAKANRVFFEYVVRESMAALMKILYNQIKEEIIKLVTTLAVRLIKESAEKRVKQILSLFGGSSTTSGIQTIIPPEIGKLADSSS